MKENTENNIVEMTAETILDYPLDSMVDIAEIGLDGLLNESILKELPIVKTIVNIAKTGFAVREKHMLKKTLIFIRKLNTNALSSSEYDRYKEKLKSKDKFLYSELENVLIIIDRFVETNKAKILANLFYNYIIKNLTWEEFQELAMIVDNIFISDLTELSNIYTKNQLTMNDIVNQISFNRLKTQNLVDDIKTTIRNQNGIGVYYRKYDYRITHLGIKLFEYGASGL